MIYLAFSPSSYRLIARDYHISQYKSISSRNNVNIKPKDIFILYL